MREGHRMFADQFATDECVANHGIEGAWEAMVAELRPRFIEAAEAWKGRGAEISLTLGLKRPDATDPDLE